MSFSLLITVAAAISISVGSANVFRGCIDNPINIIGSKFTIRCGNGEIIIVGSALIGATSGYKSSTDCPVTDTMCTTDVTFAAEYCAGYNSCEIAQRLLLYNESHFSCAVSNFTSQGANFISINYSCVTPRAEFYGDISLFEADLFTNSSMPAYISSYPNFPNGIPPTGPFRCSCSYFPKLVSFNTTTSWITIRTVLVKLSSIDPNSEVLSIRFGNETRLNFNSPSTTVNNITSVPLNSAFTITYERKSYVAAATSKFFLELKVGSSSASGTTAGRIWCNSSYLTDSSTSMISTSSSSSSTLKYVPSTSPLQSTALSSSDDSFDSSSTFPSTMKIDLTPVASISGNQRSQSQRSSMTPGAIAGIVIGSVALLTLIVIVTILLVIIRKRKKRKQMHGMFINVNQTFNLDNGVHINQFDLSENPVHSTFSTKLAQTDNQRNGKVVANSSAYDKVAPVELPPSSLAKVRTATELRPKAEIIMTAANAVEDTRMTATVGYGEREMEDENHLIIRENSVEEEGKEEEDETEYVKEQQPKDSDSLHISRNSALILVDNEFYDGANRPAPSVVPAADYELFALGIRSTNAPSESTDESSKNSLPYEQQCVSQSQLTKANPPHSYYNILPPEENSKDSDRSSGKGISHGLESENAGTENSMLSENDEVVLIDNTMYGSIVNFN